MNHLDNKDTSEYIGIYERRFARFGYSPMALGWNTGKQEMRFELLRNGYDLEDCSILDVGCGFGDLNRYLQAHCHSYTYTGVDLVSGFISKAKELYPASDRYDIRFMEGDFLECCFDEPFDYVFASGIFGKKLQGNDNYDYVDTVVRKAVELTRFGAGLDFSTSVGQQLRKSYGFIYDPGRIVSIVAKYTNNFILNHAYFPTEFSILINKDRGFSPNNVFNSYLAAYGPGNPVI